LTDVKFREVIEYVKEDPPAKKVRRANLIVRVIGNGINHYARFVINLFGVSEITIDGKTYEVKQESFFLVNYGFLKRFARWLKRKIAGPGIETYHAVYLEGAKEPLILAKPPEDTASSRLLKIIRESTALKRGISELFRTQLGGKQFLFIVLLLGIVVFAVLVLTGQIDLSGMI